MQPTHHYALRRIASPPPRNISRADGLWSKGLLLDAAAWALCPSQFRSRHNESRSPKHGERLNENVRSLRAADLKKQPGLYAAVPLELVQIILAPGVICNEMRDWLKERLAAGRLFAYGDLSPIDSITSPILISPEYFGLGEIDWSKSSLRIGTNEFVAIKVFRPKSFQHVQVLPPDPSILKRMVGRPTKKADVFAILHDMNKEGSLPQLGIDKRIVDKIRKRVIGKNSGRNMKGTNPEAGLSNQTVTRIYSEFMQRADCQNSK